MYGSTYDRQPYSAAATNAIFMIFGRTDLRIGGSRAKLNVEVDGEVHSALAPPKAYEIDEKLSSRSKNFVDFFFLPSKNETSGIVRNVFSQSLAGVRAVFEG